MLTRRSPRATDPSRIFSAPFHLLWKLRGLIGLQKQFQTNTRRSPDSRAFDQLMGNANSTSLDSIGREYHLDQSSLRHGYLKFYEVELNGLVPLRKVVIIAAGQADHIAMCFAKFLPSAMIHVFSVGGQQEPSIELPPAVSFTHSKKLEEVVWKVRQLDALDVIIEDGNNKKSTKLKFFRELFWHLRKGGLYFCEDLHAAGIGSLVDMDGFDILEYINSLCAIRRLPKPLPSLSKFDAALAQAMGKVSNYGRLLVVQKAQDHLLKVVEDHRSLSVLRTRAVDWMVDRKLKDESVFDTRASVLTNRTDFSAERFPGRIKLPELHIRTYDNVIYVPRQIIVKAGLLLPDTFRLFRKPYVLNEQLVDCSKNYARLRDEAALRAEPAEGRYFHIDSEYPHQYGHAITEIVSRLYGWRLAKREDPKVKMLISSGGGDADRWGSLKPWVRLILTAYGVLPNEVRVRNSPSRVEAVTAVTPQFSNLGFAHPDILYTWDELALTLRESASVGSLPRRIFVARGAGLKNRKCRNNSQVEAMFEERGFAIVYPEKLPLPEQVALFSNAEEVAGFGGSGMISAAIFGMKLARMVVISPETYNAINEYLIASVRGNEIVYIYSEAEQKHPLGGWSQQAFQSAFTFDMGRDGGFLRNALNSR